MLVPTLPKLNRHQNKSGLQYRKTCYLRTPPVPVQQKVVVKTQGHIGEKLYMFSQVSIRFLSFLYWKGMKAFRLIVEKKAFMAEMIGFVHLLSQKFKVKVRCQLIPAHIKRQ